MCSISGFISSRPLSPWLTHRLCSALLFYGESRGSQSSGIYINQRLLKRAQAANTFIDDPEFLDLFSQPSAMAILHNRLPTSGGTGDEQAHPFWIGNTITVHNGGIYNCKDLKEKWNLEKPSGVDSELFCSAIHTLGIENFHKVMADVSGNAALAIIHEGELFLARDGNPLEYMQLDMTDEEGDFQLLVFGSTQSQVKDSLAHLWLLKGYRQTITLASEKIFKVSPGGTLTDSGPFATKSYSSSHSHSHSHHQGHMPWPHRSGTDGGTSWIPSWTETIRNGERTIEVGGHYFTIPELQRVFKDKDIPVPDKHYGCGWEKQNKYGCVVYNAELSAKQKIKFLIPSMAMIAFGDQKKKGEKKAKKDRNRNRSSLALVPYTGTPAEQAGQHDFSD